MTRSIAAFWTKFALSLAFFALVATPAVHAHNSACTSPLILPVDHFTWGYAQRAQYVRDRLARAGENEFLDELDYILGLNTSDIEHRDAEAVEYYKNVLRENLFTRAELLGLKSRHSNWFTGYRELAQLIEALKLQAGDVVVDLGAGTGRLGLLLSVLRPDVSYVGIELVHTRVEAAKKAIRMLGVQNKVRFEQADLLDPYLKIPVGTHYYVYGPTNDIHMNDQVIDRVLNETDHSFKVITHHPLTIQVLFGAKLRQLTPVKGHLHEFRIFQKTDSPRP